MNYADFVNKLPYALASVDREKNAAYNAEERRLSDAFKLALFQELDIVDHPKRDDLFNLAWQYGHANGLSDVFEHASDFVILLD